MTSNRMSDLIVQIAATVIATGIVSLVAQAIGMSRRLTRVEDKMVEVLKYIADGRRDFHDSHEVFEDGEYHHRRRGRG